MNTKIKIAYLTVGENLNAELLQRQVVELLGDIKSTAPDFEITIFSFQGVLSIYNRRKDITASKLRLRSFGIDMVIIPNICPWPFPNLSFKKTDVGWRPNPIWTKFALISFQLITLPLMLFLRLYCGYRLYHCRSYPATSIAIFLKKIIPDTAVLFDPRSDFPEENVTSGVWAKDSKVFHFWKKTEQEFLITANAVACIGPTYVDHYKKNAVTFNYFIAPNNVRCSEFKRKLSDRDTTRVKLGIREADHVYVYLGGMSSNEWHRPDFYMQFYDSLRKLSEDFKFMFLVPKHAANLVRDAFGTRENVIVTSPEIDEVGIYLSASDFGMMFLHKSKIAVGTKIGEYLAASLPVLVNPNCLGAVELINSNPGIGYVINLGIGDLDTFMHFDSEASDSISHLLCSDDHLANFAFDYFDNARVADIYIQQYKNMLQPASL